MPTDRTRFRREALALNPEQRAHHIGEIESAIRGAVDAMGPQSDPQRLPRSHPMRGETPETTVQNLADAHARLEAFKTVADERRDAEFLERDPLDHELRDLNTRPTGGSAVNHDLRDAIRAALDDWRGAHPGQRLNEGRGASINVELPEHVMGGLVHGRPEASLTTAAGYPSESVRSGLVTETGISALSFLDLIGPPMGLDSTNFVFMRARHAGANAAGVGLNAGRTMDTAAAARAEGASLAETSPVWDEVTVPARSVGTYVEVTEESLEDSAQLGTILEMRLRRGVRQRLNALIAAGNGTAPNIAGFASYAADATSVATARNTFGAMDVIDLKSGVDDDSAKRAAKMLDGLRNACAAVETRWGMPPTGAAIHPRMRAGIDLLKGSDGHYLATKPDTGTMDLWRMPIAHDAYWLGDGSANGVVGLVGDFNEAQLMIRHDLRIEFGVTGDQFKNLERTARAYLRACLVITNPMAFVLLSAMTGA